MVQTRHEPVLSTRYQFRISDRPVIPEQAGIHDLFCPQLLAGHGSPLSTVNKCPRSRTSVINLMRTVCPFYARRAVLTLSVTGNTLPASESLTLFLPHRFASYKCLSARFTHCDQSSSAE